MPTGLLQHGEECHTAVEGEECYEHVTWAMTTGIKEHPENYGHLTADSSFAEFQDAIRAAHPSCPKPCLPEAGMVARAKARAQAAVAKAKESAAAVATE